MACERCWYQPCIQCQAKKLYSHQQQLLKHYKERTNKVVGYPVGMAHYIDVVAGMATQMSNNYSQYTHYCNGSVEPLSIPLNSKSGWCADCGLLVPENQLMLHINRDYPGGPTVDARVSALTDAEVAQTGDFKALRDLISVEFADDGKILTMARDALACRSHRELDEMLPASVDKASEAGKMEPVTFKLKPNASRRTKQRWRAHASGNCNPSKCRFCKKKRKQAAVVAAYKTYGNTSPEWKPANNEQAENRLHRRHKPKQHCGCVCATNILMVMGCQCGSMEPCICYAPTHCTCGFLAKRHKHDACGGPSECCFCMAETREEHDRIAAVMASVDKTGEPGIINPCQEVAVADNIKTEQGKSQNLMKPLDASAVLQHHVSQSYGAAAKRVAYSKAQAEIWREAMTPGMMVWHRYNHHSCILKHETAPGLWTVEMPDGREEMEVSYTILAPMQPPAVVRGWMFLCNTMHNIFYREVEIQTDRGFITQEQFNSKLIATGMLGFVVLSLVAHLLG